MTIQTKNPVPVATGTGREILRIKKGNAESTPVAKPESTPPASPPAPQPQPPIYYLGQTARGLAMLIENAPGELTEAQLKAAGRLAAELREKVKAMKIAHGQQVAAERRIFG